MENFMNNKQGFSLVELMVVIAIIAILSAIAVPNYKSYVVRARIAELMTISENVQLRINQKYNEGLNWTAITDLGFAAAPTSTYISASAAAPASTNATTLCTAAVATPPTPGGAGLTGAVSIGSVTVTGNAAAIGVPSGTTIAVVKVGCLLNDVVQWVCGLSTGSTAANSAYLPANCQIVFSGAP